MLKSNLFIKITCLLWNWLSPLLMGIIMISKPIIIGPKFDFILGCFFLGYFIINTIILVKDKKSNGETLCVKMMKR